MTAEEIQAEMLRRATNKLRDTGQVFEPRYPGQTVATYLSQPEHAAVLGALSALEACQREREHLLGFMGVEHAGCSYLATRFEPFGWACNKCGRTGAARNLADAAALARLQADLDESYAMNKVLLKERNAAVEEREKWRTLAGHMFGVIRDEFGSPSESTAGHDQYDVQEQYEALAAKTCS